MTDNSAHGYSEGSEVYNKHPDFPDWVKSKEGQSCLTWPVGDTTYLKNRLFWAFDAGRNCVWEQYLQNKSELKRKDEEINESKQRLEDAYVKQAELLQGKDSEIQQLKEEIKHLRKRVG